MKFNINHSLLKSDKNITKIRGAASSSIFSTTNIVTGVTETESDYVLTSGDLLEIRTQNIYRAKILLTVFIVIGIALNIGLLMLSNSVISICVPISKEFPSHRSCKLNLGQDEDICYNYKS